MSISRKDALSFDKKNSLFREESDNNHNISSQNVNTYEVNNKTSTSLTENTSQCYMVKNLTINMRDSLETSSRLDKILRERRKVYKKTSKHVKRIPLEDEPELHRKGEEDYCDCLQITCEGCFMPCPNCQSRKCGHECRVGRKWVYDSVEHDGDVRKNSHK